MLPERISNNLCSLVPGEPRGALAVRLVIGNDGRKRSHSFHRVLMRSAAKLAYAQAQAAIDGRPDDTTGPLLDPILKPLYAAYQLVKIARNERDPLDLDLPERKILLYPDGTVDRVIVPERLDAHKLIEVVLRSQAQAEYSAENYGHFGLNLRRYAHFTSPIRRYADLIVHRALIRSLGLGEGALPQDETLETLSEIAAQISVTERRAMKAERETADRLIAHFLADKIGASFQGRIPR